MLGAPRSWPLAMIPVIWSFIGGSAAVFLDVRADYALPIAGIALVMFSTRRNRELQPVASDGALKV
jgi:hypothetical protein